MLRWLGSPEGRWTIVCGVGFWSLVIAAILWMFDRGKRRP
jgi:hypothetical protein